MRRRPTLTIAAIGFVVGAVGGYLLGGFGQAIFSGIIFSFGMGLGASAFTGKRPHSISRDSTPRAKEPLTESATKRVGRITIAVWTVVVISLIGTIISWAFQGRVLMILLGALTLLGLLQLVAIYRTARWRARG